MKRKTRFLCSGHPRHIYCLSFFPRPVKNSLSMRKLISRNTIAVYVVFLYFGICRYSSFFFIVLCLATSTVSYSLVHLFGNEVLGFQLTVTWLTVLLKRNSWSSQPVVFFKSSAVVFNGWWLPLLCILSCKSFHAVIITKYELEMYQRFDYKFNPSRPALTWYRDIRGQYLRFL